MAKAGVSAEREYYTAIPAILLEGVGCSSIDFYFVTQFKETNYWLYAARCACFLLVPSVSLAF